MLESVNIVSIFLTIMIVMLIILFFVSLISFVRRKLTHQGHNTNSSVRIEEKLDKIIELLEDNKSAK